MKKMNYFQNLFSYLCSILFLLLLFSCNANNHKNIEECSYQVVCDPTLPNICCHNGQLIGPCRTSMEEAQKDSAFHKKNCPKHTPQILQMPCICETPATFPACIPMEHD